MLPLDEPPLPGEALPAYLLRIADLMKVTSHAVYDHLGLRSAGRTLRYVHLSLPDATRHEVAARLGLRDEDDLARTLVDTFAGLDLQPLTGPGAADAHRTVQRQQWIWMSCTHFCLSCLREARPWENTWQLPWAYACCRHHELLRAVCSGCGRRPDLVVRRGAGADASDLTRCACGQPWTENNEAPPVTRTDETVQASLLSAAEGGTELLWGAPADGRTRLAVWRAVGAVTARSSGIRPWARRPFLVPPTEPADMATIAELSAPVLEAADLSGAADAFGRLLGDRTGAAHGESAVWDVIPRTSPVAPVARLWLQRSGRVHARLSRVQRDAFALVPVAPNLIPTLGDVRHLPTRWIRERLPQVELRQAALSLAVARLAGAGTWQAAGEMLAIDGPYAARVVRRTLHRLGPDSAAELTGAAQRYARALVSSRIVQARPKQALCSAAGLRAWSTRTLEGARDTRD